MVLAFARLRRLRLPLCDGHPKLDDRVVALALESGVDENQVEVQGRRVVGAGELAPVHPVEGVLDPRSGAQVRKDSIRARRDRHRFHSLRELRRSTRLGAGNIGEGISAAHVEIVTRR